jgi:4-amino-4-deoxy-L-arabinose transferase-like glycosyltransferase
LFCVTEQPFHLYANITSILFYKGCFMTVAYKIPEASGADATVRHTDLQTRLAAQPTLLWHRIAKLAIVALSTFFIFYNVSINGYGNTYYAACVRSMLESWHNFFFVSFDPGGFVTVDKPPLGLWLEALSAKIFGFSGFSLMLPQAIAGIFSILIVYHLVRRSFGPLAGLIAALVLGLTPISLVMSRDNNQDMMMVFFLILAAWCVIVAAERGSLGLLCLCAVNVALAFNVKTLEADLLVPAFGLLYLLAAPISWGRRAVHLALACVLMAVLSLAWLVAVDMTPAAQRPYVGSSQNNSEISLALGYNGVQRLIGMNGGGGNHSAATDTTGKNTTTAGSSTTKAATAGTSTSQSSQGGPGGQGAPGGQSGGPGGGGGPFNNGAAGPLRLLNSSLGGQSGWFIPLALVAMLALAWQSRLLLPLSRSHQALVLWGMWFLACAGFFAVANFFHPYYLVIMAPATAALAGIGLVLLWYAYCTYPVTDWRCWLLPAGLLFTAAGQVYILKWYSNWSFLQPVIIALCLLAAIVLVLVKVVPRIVPPMVPLRSAATSLALIALLITPLTWSYISDQASTAGSMPSAGPSTMSMNFPGAANRGNVSGERPQSQAEATNRDGFASGGRPRGMGGGNQGDATINSKLLSYLEANQGTTKFLFATSSSQEAAPYIIQTGKAVMAMGGFSGSDPILTQQSLAQLVKNNTVRFFLLGSGGPGGSGSSITSWVQQHCTVVPASEWQTSSTSSSAGFGGPGGGSQQLYDCASAR